MTNVRQTDREIDWCFTFGSGQPHEGHYHIVYGTCDNAREKMFQRFGDKWSMQYESREQAGVDFFELKEIK